jgi:DNA-binding transcriptional LysR family regulator
LRDYFMADGGPGPRLESAGSIDAVKRSVLADPQALGVLPAYALDEELRARLVRVVPVRPRLPRLRLVARLGRRAPASPVVAELVDALRSAPRG